MSDLKGFCPRLYPVWHLAAITLTRGGRCNIAHCPRADIYSNARLLPRCVDSPSLSLSLPPRTTPNVRLTRLLYVWLSRASLFPSAAFLSSFSPSAVSFRRAREPLISADFARRADPWNPRGYLSPGGSFLSVSLPPLWHLDSLFVPPEFSDARLSNGTPSPLLCSSLESVTLFFFLRFLVTAPSFRVVYIVS